jgi:hypothetical protein
VEDIAKDSMQRKTVKTSNGVELSYRMSIMNTRPHLLQHLTTLLVGSVITLLGHITARVWDEAKPVGENICGKKSTTNKVKFVSTGTIPADSRIDLQDFDGDGLPDYLSTDRYGATQVWFQVVWPSSGKWISFGQLTVSVVARNLLAATETVQSCSLNFLLARERDSNYSSSFTK